MVTVLQLTSGHQLSLSPPLKNAAMIIEKTRGQPKVDSKIAAVSGTLMVPATNLPQHAAISMLAILVVKITGQWSVRLYYTDKFATDPCYWHG